MGINGNIFIRGYIPYRGLRRTTSRQISFEFLFIKTSPPHILDIGNGNTFLFPNIEEQNGKHPLPPVQIQLSRRPMLFGCISSWCWEGREG